MLGQRSQGRIGLGAVCTGTEPLPVAALLNVSPSNRPGSFSDGSLAFVSPGGSEWVEAASVGSCLFANLSVPGGKEKAEGPIFKTLPSSCRHIRALKRSLLGS